MAVHFETTLWSVLRTADRDPGRACDFVARRYRDPLYQYLRQRGFQPADAEDLVQETFARVCDPKFLAAAEEPRGRFRTLVMAVLNHVLASYWRKRTSLKRGGGRPHHPFHSGDAPLSAIMEAAGGMAKDDEFNRLWAEALVKSALGRFDSDDRQGRVIRMFYFEDRSSRAIGEALGVPVKTVENDLAAARRKLRSWISEQVREYATTSDEYEEEIAELSRYR